MRLALWMLLAVTFAESGKSPNGKGSLNSGNGKLHDPKPGHLPNDNPHLPGHNSDHGNHGSGHDNHGNHGSGHDNHGNHGNSGHGSDDGGSSGGLPPPKTTTHGGLSLADDVAILMLANGNNDYDYDYYDYEYLPPRPPPQFISSSCATGNPLLNHITGLGLYCDARTLCPNGYQCSNSICCSMPPQLSPQFLPQLSQPFQPHLLPQLSTNVCNAVKNPFDLSQFLYCGPGLLHSDCPIEHALHEWVVLCVIFFVFFHCVNKEYQERSM